MLATTALLTHDLDLAEECTQDAYERALRAWPDHGIPDRPGAWLTTTARNRARDVLRRESAFRRAMPLLVPEQTEPGPETGFGDDGRLRLIFTCCHPALSGDAQIALTLRLVCGLSTAEVARAFLVREPTMAARITRAKKKISAARIPYRVPSPDQLDERVSVVLEVVHLIFTTGHTAPGARAGPPGPGRQRDQPGAPAAPAHAHPGRHQRPAGAAAAHRRPCAEPGVRGRPPAAALGAGSHALGPAADRRGHRAADRRPAARGADQVRGRGRDRRHPRRGVGLAGHRLDRDHRAV